MCGEFRRKQLRSGESDGEIREEGEEMEEIIGLRYHGEQYVHCYIVILSAINIGFTVIGVLPFLPHDS